MTEPRERFDEEMLRKGSENYVLEISDVIAAAQPRLDDFMPDYVLGLDAQLTGQRTRASFLGLSAYMITYATLEGESARRSGLTS